jgi:hypothetical protein
MFGCKHAELHTPQKWSELKVEVIGRYYPIASEVT